MKMDVQRFSVLGSVFMLDESYVKVVNGSERSLMMVLPQYSAHFGRPKLYPSKMNERCMPIMANLWPRDCQHQLVEY
jgi:hypothetical protein